MPETSKSDVVCFTGGEDVDPALYGEEAISETYCNPARDAYEAQIYSEALSLQKPMIGICRGSQFLNVMNGGKLWQDVDNHALRSGHAILDTRTGETVHNMTSTHHQMMIPTEKASVLATADLSRIKKSQSETKPIMTNDHEDTEVVWYNDSLSLCFQPHPEFNQGECRNYFLDLVDEFILPAC